MCLDAFCNRRERGICPKKSGIFRECLKQIQMLITLFFMAQTTISTMFFNST